MKEQSKYETISEIQGRLLSQLINDDDNNNTARIEYRYAITLKRNNNRKAYEKQLEKLLAEPE